MNHDVIIIYNINRLLHFISRLPILCKAVGGTTLSLAGPSWHLILMAGLHAVCTVALHHKHRQSWSLDNVDFDDIYYILSSVYVKIYWNVNT